MKCSEIQNNLALYTGGRAPDTIAAPLKAHLDACPLCRQSNAEYRELRANLQMMRRPEITSEMKRSIHDAVRYEIRSNRNSFIFVPADVREWLQMRLMPYSVGVFASLAVAVTFLTLMFSGMLKSPEGTQLAGNRTPYAATKSNFSGDFSPGQFVALGLSEGSPGVNPQGALIALTKSFANLGMQEDEVVVVADVFSNGLAQIAEVVEPSRNTNAVRELQKALASDPAYAPFVPSISEGRPESVRVILKFQSVNVDIGAKQNRSRL